jgi:hypothetical protein
LCARISFQMNSCMYRYYMHTLIHQIISPDELLHRDTTA